MRDRVLGRPHLDYEPDFLAQSLRRGQTLSVGFVLADIANPLMADLCWAPRRTCAKRATRSCSRSTRTGDPGVDAERIRLLLSRRVDGLICRRRARTSRRRSRRSARPGCRSSSSTAPCRPACPPAPALTDHGDGDRGRGRPPHRARPPAVRVHLGSGRHVPVRARLGAPERSLDGRAGVAFTAVHGPLSVEHGRRAALDLLSRSDRPTALITGGLRHLAGALEAVRELDLRLPTDVSLVTCETRSSRGLHAPAIACVARDAVMLGTEAAGIVRAMVAGGPPRTSHRPTTSSPGSRARPHPEPAGTMGSHVP